MGDEPATDATVARLWLCRATRQVLANGLGRAGRRAPRSACDGASGRSAARRRAARPVRARAGRRPDGTRRLRSGRAARAAPPREPLQFAGVDVRDLAERVRHAADGAGRERLPVSRCQDFADAFGGAGERALRREGVPVGGDRPLAGRARASALDVCSGGELALALQVRVPARPDRAARLQQVRRRTAGWPSRPGSARSSSTRSTRSAGWPVWPSRGSRKASDRYR